jgi:hypothetical protein
MFYVMLRTLEVKLTGRKDPIRQHGDEIECHIPSTPMKRSVIEKEEEDDTF